MPNTRIKWRLKQDRLPGGDAVYTGWLDIPTTTPGKFIKLKATEKTPKKAMTSVTNAAWKLLANPVVRDLLPPGTQSAIAIAKKLIRTKKAKKFVVKATKKAYNFLKSLW